MVEDESAPGREVTGPLKSDGGTGLTGRTRGRLMASGLAGTAALVAAAIMGSAPASADAGMKVTMGTPTVAARLLVSVPVSVVCAEIPGTVSTVVDSVTVSIEQAAGQGVATATGQMIGGSFYGTSGLFTCDGTTANNFTLSLVANSPFHGGPAVVTVTAQHGVSTDPYCQWCTGASETTQIGPQTVTIKS